MGRTLIAALLAGLAAAPGALGAEAAARYRLDVDVSWSAATHPLDFPAGAHLTRLVGCAHDARYVLFGDGRTGSSGLESVAERGRTALLTLEMEEGQGRKRVGAIFGGDGLQPVPGAMTATFAASAEHDLASFVSMVAPSPDWFTGVSGVPLRADGAWLDRVVVPLWAWDAGTGAGASYGDGGPDSQPRESTRLLATPHFLGPDGLRRIGTATFTRVE